MFAILNCTQSDCSLLTAILVMAIIGLLLGLIIGIVAKIFKVETDPRIELVASLLPNANCGGCGRAGCADFAKAVVAGEVAPNQCPASSQETVNSIAKALGIEANASFKKVAVVLCGGDKNQTKNWTLYNGVNDCRSAMLIAGGPKACSYGCLGMASCARACPFGAIEIVNGLAIVHSEKCVGCGKCVATCPRKLIKLVPADAQVHVYCNNPEKGPAKKKYCNVPCLGCRKCDKNAPGKFTFEGFHAVVNYEAENLPTVDDLDAIKCPTNCLLSAREHLAIEESNPDHVELAKENSAANKE